MLHCLHDTTDHNGRKGGWRRQPTPPGLAWPCPRCWHQGVCTAQGVKDHIRAVGSGGRVGQWGHEDLRSIEAGEGDDDWQDGQACARNREFGAQGKIGLFGTISNILLR